MGNDEGKKEEVGRIYAGEWKDDVMDGHGVDSMGDSQRYEGQFKGSTNHGLGVLRLGEQGNYAGEWKFDMQQGLGVLTYGEREAVYEGEWSQNKFEGLGVFAMLKGKEAGQKEEGIFIKGLLKAPKDAGTKPVEARDKAA